MIDRRGAMHMIGMAASFATATRPGGTQSASVTLATQADRLRAFMLMRGALDDRVVIGCLSGMYYGVVAGVSRPLFAMTSATFSRFRPLRTGGYEGVTLEQSYFLDALTGNWITRFANPYTGKTVDVPTGGYPPARIIFTSDLEMIVPASPPDQALTHSTSPFRVQGDHVFVTEITTGTTPGRDGKAPLQYHEVVGLHARTAELAAPGAKKVRCETSYTSVKSWRSWLDMADYPGETVSTGQGVYGAGLSELPAEWLAAARRHRPGLIADPAKALDPLWQSL